MTGSEGCAHWDGGSIPVCEVIDESRPKAFLNPMKTMNFSSEWEGQEGHWGCLDEMFSSIEENRLAETDSSDNIKSVAMVFGA